MNDNDWIHQAAQNERDNLRRRHEETKKSNRLSQMRKAHAPALLTNLRNRVKDDVSTFTAASDNSFRVQFMDVGRYGFRVRRGEDIAVTVTPVDNDAESIDVVYKSDRGDTEKHDMLHITGDEPQSLSFFTRHRRNAMTLSLSARDLSSPIYSTGQENECS